MYTGRVQRDSARWDSAALSTARVGFSQCSKHRYYRVALEFAAMRARIAYERLNELQRRRLIRRTSAHNPVPLLIGEHREVLHRLHISPTGQRFRRAWDGDVPPGALSAALEALTIACQLARVFDCSRCAPHKGHGHNQPYRQDARIFHRRIASSRIPRALPGISIPEQLSGRRPPQRSSILDELPWAAFDVVYHRCLVAHYRHGTDGNKSGKSKGTCTGLGQINAAAFNIRPSVRDRDRDGITILLVGDLDLGTKGQ